ncbi:MAG: hypothetical protein AAB771_01135 [Patescibacteria group bacterium]
MRKLGTIFLFLFLIIIFMIISFNACPPSRRHPDEQVRTIVRNTWNTTIGFEKIKMIQVQTEKQDYYGADFAEISEFYFQDFKPEVGDCVMVWAEIKKWKQVLVIQEISVRLNPYRDIEKCR